MSTLTVACPNASYNKTRKITLIALFAAISTVLMYFEMPLPFMPPFLKLDPSGVPILLASMLFGPGAAISVTVVKDLIHVLSTTTGGVGELADFILLSTFSIVVGYIYQHRSDKKGVLLATLCGTLTCTFVGVLANRFLLIPFFSKVMPIESIFAACAKLNPAISGLETYLIFGVAPFNLIKGLVLTAFTFLLYRKMEGFLKHYLIK